VQGPGFFLRVALQKAGRRPPEAIARGVGPDYWG